MKATPRRAGSTGYRLNRELVDQLATKAGATTADEIAGLFGIDRSTYFRLLNGESVPKLDTALQMAAIAQADVTKLFVKAA